MSSITWKGDGNVLFTRIIFITRVAGVFLPDIHQYCHPDNILHSNIHLVILIPIVVILNLVILIQIMMTMIRLTRVSCGLMVWQHWGNLKDQERPLRWSLKWSSSGMIIIIIIGTCLIFVMLILYFGTWGMKLERSCNDMKFFGFSWLELEFWLRAICLFLLPTTSFSSLLLQKTPGNFTSQHIACFLQTLWTRTPESIVIV